MRLYDPPNKSPGGGHAISGAFTEVRCKIIFPEKFQNVKRQNRLLSALTVNELWAEAYQRIADEETLWINSSGLSDA